MKYITFLFALVISLTTFAQNTSAENDSLALRKLYDMSLLNGKSYEWLDHLSNQIGGRLSGSIQAEQAVQYTKKELEKLGLDKVWLQPVMVPKWTRGTKEYAYIETKPGESKTVNICALGGSVPTPVNGLKAEVIEVQGLEDLAEYGKEQIEGKIVFYNRPMRANLIQTFEAYGGCVD